MCRVWLVVLIPAAFAPAGSSAIAQPANNQHLIELVEAFMRSEDGTERGELAVQIGEVSYGSIEDVAEALSSARLWSDFPEKQGAVEVRSASLGPVEVAYRLPPGYVPTRQYPLIVCTRGDGQTPLSAIQKVSRRLGDAAEGFVLVCSASGLEDSFHRSTAAAYNPRKLMRGLRRRFHIDSNRVFLCGLDDGGRAAWITAILYPDLFAGILVSSAYPGLPYPAQAYPLLLENLRRVDVLNTWRIDDPAAVVAHCRAIVDYAGEVALPIVGVEFRADPTTGAERFREEVGSMLNRRRGLVGNEVSHRFRYPDQGRAWWLRQTKPLGDVWEAEQLSILPTPGIDRHDFITDVIADKLAYLGGRIKGQTITIETRHCGGIELLLPDGLMDLSRPVTVVCNGRRRFQDVIRPSVRTMLETAYEDWDLQGATVARLSFSVRTDSPHR